MNIEQELSSRVSRGAVRVVPRPSVALNLRKLLGDPKHAVQAVADVVRQCPLLSAAVLRLANSVALKRTSTVTSLSAAVSRVGEKELERLAFASGLTSANAYDGPLLSVRRLAQQQALMSAFICEHLAPFFMLDAEELFLAGLIHDVGRQVALGTLDLILAQQPGAPTRTAEAWLQLADTHHVALGLSLAKNWELPDSLRQAIEQHHAPDDEQFDVTAVVRASDALIAHLQTGAPLADAPVRLLKVLYPDQLEQLETAFFIFPSVIEALEQGDPVSAAKSAVSAPPAPAPAPRAELCEVRLGKGRVGKLTEASRQRLRVRAPTRLTENFLAELELDLPSGTAKFWARVVRAEAADAGGLHDTELVPFAPTREVLDGLEALSRKAAAGSAASA